MVPLGQVESGFYQRPSAPFPPPLEKDRYPIHVNNMTAERLGKGGGMAERGLSLILFAYPAEAEIMK